MQKRYQIFVSSTFDDLKEERSKVITALLDLGHIPCGMEYFPAADEDAWNCIERLIPKCDYYVVLVAGRYGCIPDGELKSYTHKEYELAVANGVPVLGLLHAKPGELPRKHCESDPKVEKKLDQFRAQVKRKLCRFWTNADQIPGQLLASLTQQIDRIPRTGWVRADSVASEDAKNEIISLRRTIEKKDAMIEQLQTIEQEVDAQLASGEDELRFGGKLLNYYASGMFVSWDEEYQVEAYVNFELVTSWNMILRFIASHGIKRWKTNDLQRWLEVEVMRMAKSLHREFKGSKLKWIDLVWDQGQLRKIEIQLSALGLISPRDNGWLLTAKGFTYANRQMALRKGEINVDLSGWAKIVTRGNVAPKNV